MINLTIFCSSKNNLNPIYYDLTRQLITLLDHKKFSIVYGGGTSGIMGTVRNTFMNKGGNIISSNVDRFVEPNIHDDYLYTNIDDRQKKMIELGAGYLILPGGYGTHFELLEVMTKNDIGETNKPIFIFNCNNIFDNVIKLINDLNDTGFITRNLDRINVKSSANIDELSTLINNYDFTKN